MNVAVVWVERINDKIYSRVYSLDLLRLSLYPQPTQIFLTIDSKQLTFNSRIYYPDLNWLFNEHLK
jgi:hypothetical protein